MGVQMHPHARIHVACFWQDVRADEARFARTRASARAFISLALRVDTRALERTAKGACQLRSSSCNLTTLINSVLVSL
eukprot:12900607-Prorocentrum_lima.AAC.1